MKITKLGHCCLLIEEKNVRILTDPGNYSNAQDNVKEIDLILITHEHKDHLHIDSLETVLKNNPKARIITNTSVGKILTEKKITFEIVTHGMKTQILGITIEGIGEKHAEIYKTVLSVENTGYFISQKLFYPGDAFTNPQREIDVLALPVAGPWMKISESLDYALTVKPKIAFPVHDGMLQKDKLGPAHVLPERELTKAGIKFITLLDGQSIDV